MIELYFPSKREKPVYIPQVYQRPNFTTPAVSNAPSAFEEARAQKKGLSVTEYRKRVAEVSKAQRDSFIQTGDTVWPSLKEPYEKYGKCLVVGVCRHYDDYGDVEWNDPPFILAISPMNDKGSVINCTTGYVQKYEPHFTIKEC